MSAEPIQGIAYIPMTRRRSGRITRADVRMMAMADEINRYELDPGGVLVVMSPPGGRHSLVVNTLVGWLVRYGFGPNRYSAQDHAIDTGGEGFRVPDLIAWPHDREITDDWVTPGDQALLVVEVISPSSVTIDRVNKKSEYAKAGVPRYWIVDGDTQNTVTRYVLDEATGAYLDDPAGARTALAWILARPPSL